MHRRLLHSPVFVRAALRLSRTRLRGFQRPARRSQGAFTLLEIMLVLAIAGILYLVALPGYQQAMVKSTRAAARGILVNVQSRQEQYFVNNKRYATRLESLGLPAPFYIDRQAEAVNVDAAAYRIELDVEDDEYQGVRAVPLNRQAGDSPCMTFTLSSIGIRAVTGTRSANPRECW